VVWKGSNFEPVLCGLSPPIFGGSVAGLHLYPLRRAIDLPVATSYSLVDFRFFDSACVRFRVLPTTMSAEVPREESQNHRDTPCQPTPLKSLAAIAGRG
jgi:hypothetical protein